MLIYFNLCNNYNLIHLLHCLLDYINDTFTVDVIKDRVLEQKLGILLFNIFACFQTVFVKMDDTAKRSG